MRKVLYKSKKIKAKPIKINGKSVRYISFYMRTNIYKRKDNELDRFKKIIKFYSETIENKYNVESGIVRLPDSRIVHIDSFIHSWTHYIKSIIKSIDNKFKTEKPSFIYTKPYDSSVLIKYTISLIEHYKKHKSLHDNWESTMVYIEDLIKEQMSLEKSPHLYGMITNKKAFNRYTKGYQYINKARHQNKNIKATPKDRNIEKDEEYDIFPVMYGTSRNPIKFSDNITLVGYDNKRATLHYGKCLVSLKKSDLIGEPPKSSFDKIIELFRNKEEKSRNILIKKIEKYTPEEFDKEINTLFDDIKENEVLLYIHGYNTGFKDAAKTAAQLGYDLKFGGVTTFFSWASFNTLDGYLADMETANISHKYLCQFILRLQEKTKCEKIHIISHSMGNRVFLKTLKEFEYQSTNINFGHIILVAPDLDKEEFDDNSSLYPKFSENTTLYVSPHDKAIKLSEWLRKFNRVGVSPPVVTAQNIDTINIDQKMTKALLTLGHSYYNESKDILHDLNSILRHSEPPDKRLSLKKVEVTGHHRYWNLPLST